jgi:hypothetical protein
MPRKPPGDPSENPGGGAASVPDTSPTVDAAAQPHDALFRQIFGDPVHAAATLRSIVPPRVAAHIDWDTPFEPAHASMVSGNAEQRHGDLFFKIRLIDGRGAFIWLLFEHQSSIHRWMALRMSGMVQDFLDDWHRRTPGAQYLPAVLPVVLHHGPRPWRAPTSLLELTDLSDQARADFAAHLLSLDFILDDLRTVPDQAIDARPLGSLPRLVLGIMKHAGSPQLLGFFIAHADDVRDLLTTEHGRLGLFISIRYTERVSRHLDRDTLIHHLAPLVGPGLEHTMLTFEQLLRNEEFQKGVDKGIDKGIAKGVEKGQRALVLRQLTRRFGALPTAISDRVAHASLAELEHWSDRILDAASLDDVFAAP